MTAAYDTAMADAGRDSSNTFRDLRSASRARNRTQRHRLKYNKFKRPGPTPSDLPSSPNQQPHYSSALRGSAEARYPFTAFPADLSSAPVEKFTKREAYIEAQMWPRPPTYHHSRCKKDLNKWVKRKGDMKEMKRVVFEGEHVDDADWFAYEDEMMGWLTPFDRYCYFRQDKELWEGTEDDVADEGYHTDEDTEKECPTWYWHRNFIGGWFRADWPCMWSFCACFGEWGELVGWDDVRSRQPFSLAECLGWEEELADWSSEWGFNWEVEAGLGDDVVHPFLTQSSDIVSEPDWDIVSEAESEAWSEILDVSDTDQT
jgi:hypothetical protein